MLLQNQKHRLSALGVLAMLAGGFLGQLPYVYASSWSPTLLVNTEAFQVIDDTDSAADLYIQFGDSLNKRLTYDRTIGTFIFDDDLEVIGTISGSTIHAQDALTSSGTLSVEGATRFQSATDSSTFLQVNDADGGTPIFNVDTTNERVGIRTSSPTDALTVSQGGIEIFGGSNIVADAYYGGALEWNNTDGSMSGGAEVGTIGFRATNSNGSNPRFAISIRDAYNDATLTEVFTIRDGANGNNIGIGKTSPNAKLDVVGTMSGTALTISSLQNCDTIDTDAQGNLSCGTDQSGGSGDGFTGTGALQNFFDNRYVEVGGDTMTGALTISPTTDTTTMFQVNDADGGNPVFNVDTTNERIGIGTASPTHALDVNGAGRFGGINIGGYSTIINDKYISTEDTEIGFLTDGGTALPIKVGSIAVTSSFSNNAPTNGAYIQGSVGIGTTTPDSILEVHGGGADVLAHIQGGIDTTDARLALTEIDNYGLYLEYDGTANIGYIGMGNNIAPTGSWSKRIQMSRTGTEVAFMAGNVGIGTTSPTARLHVQDGSSTGRTPNAASNIVLDDKQGNLIEFLADSGESSQHGFWWSDDTAGRAKLYYEHSADQLIFALPDDNDLLVLDKDKIGINTTSPDAKLDVVGSISGSTLTISSLQNCDTIDTDANGVLSCGTDGGLTQSTADARYVEIGGDTMTGALVIDPDADGTSVFRVNDADGGNPVLNVDTTNERIGIGTAAPSTIFNVKDGNGQLTFSGASVGSAYAAQMKLNDTAFYLGTNSTGRPLIIQNNNVDIMTFDDTAITAHKGITFEGSTAFNEGFGVGSSTDTTNNFVHINGDKGTTDDAQLLVTASTFFTGEAGFMANKNSQWNAGYFLQGDMGAALYTDGEVNLMNGNVGIGTAGPNRLLDVAGIIGWDGSHTGEVGFLSATDTSNAAIFATNDLALYTAGGNERNMHLDSSGNVGIGTTSPTEDLEVVGIMSGTQVYAADALRSSGSLIVEGDTVLQGVAASDLGYESINDDLIGYWPLSESGSAVIYDRSTNAAHGSVTSAPVWINGVDGHALNFDGIDDNVNLGDTADLQEEFTLSFWFYQDTTDAGVFISKDPDNVVWWSVRSNVSKIEAQFDDGSIKTVINIDQPNAQEWHHVTYARDKSNYYWYLNGVQQGTSVANGSLLNTGNLYLGRGRLADYFDGSLDEVRIYNRALSENEVFKLYSQQVATSSPYVTRVGGNVGIGTTSPTEDLEVIGTASGEHLHFGRLLTGSGIAIIESQTKVGSGALTVTSAEFQSGAYLYSSGASVMNLNAYVGTQSGSNAHIAFGYRDIFDTQLYRHGNYNSGGLVLRTQQGNNDDNLNAFAVVTQNGSTDNTVFKVRSDGTVTADGSFTGGGADFAEWFPTAEPGMEPGDIACLDPARPKHVKRCNSSGLTVIGVVSTKPGFIGNSQASVRGNAVLIALIGQVPTKVLGNIKIGDSIALSNTDGVGKKANGNEQTVCIAMEPHAGKETSAITCLIGRNNSGGPTPVNAKNVADYLLQNFRSSLGSDRRF